MQPIDRALEGALRRAKTLLDKAIINNDIKSVNKYNNIVDELNEEVVSVEISQELLAYRKKSSRFSRPKQRPNVSRDAASMGYAKPIQHQRISYKYNCMVTGIKRMDTCAGCSNPKGCLSNSMQYKEH
jgi:hypothetical protein